MPISSTHSGRALATAIAGLELALLSGCATSPGDQAGNQVDQIAAPISMGETADAIYVGGEIVTINDAQPTVEALAIKGGRILAVGTRADVEKAHLGASSKLVDLGGATLLPGFIDWDFHYFNSLLVANQCKLYAPPSGPAKDVDSILAALKKFAEERKTPKAELIVGYGYDDKPVPVAA